MSTPVRVLPAVVLIFVAAVLAVRIGFHDRPPGIAEDAPAHVDPPAGADPDWVRLVSADLAGREYQASVADGGLQAPNRAHNFRARFGAAGLAIEPRALGHGAGWRFGWETAAVGRAGSMVAVAPADVHAAGSRVIYERDGFREWYENSPAGVEQGFTLDRRPPGTGPVRIAGRLGGELRAELVDGAVEVFDQHGVRVLHYGELAVTDAGGRALPSWLALAGDALAIEIDDRAATYPVTVDPLFTSPSWMAEPNQTDAKFGFAVATAGDVNRDGYSDVLIGAPQFDNGQSDEGRAFLYYGSAAGLAAAPAWTAENNQALAFFGEALGPAGDVNGDGYADVIIGSHVFDNGQTDEGRAYVYHGSSSGLGTAPAWTAEGNQVGAVFGQAVGTAGDVNGDGFSDVVVGAENYDNGQTDEGRAFVYRGSATGLVTTPTWTRESDQAGAGFGVTVATAGDVNADGFADLIVGAWGYDNGEENEGRVFVYHGSASGLGALAWTAESNQLVGQMYKCATAGDVNGDGYADVIVSAPLYTNGQSLEGRAWVFYGSLSGLAAQPAWGVESNQTFANLGEVATAGDVNGDGYADVMVGARWYSNGHEYEGRAYVFCGSKIGLAGTPAWITEGNATQVLFGSVGTAGDVNGDGFSDVIVGASEFSNGQTNEGRAYVYYGGAEDLSTTPVAFIPGGQAGAGWGWTVGTAGDVNGDGYSDILMSALNFDNGQVDEGKVWAYYGTPNGPALAPAWSYEFDQPSAGISTAACAGDVNGDGYSDVIIGSATYDEMGVTDAGRVVLFLGSLSGLSSGASFVTALDQAGAYYGFSAASAGDVNADGYGDYIIGAPFWDNGQTDEGRASLFLGNAGGLAVSDWNLESNQEGAALGLSVGTAGDVNGDGFSDVLVSIPAYDHPESNEGVVWVFHGTSGGLALNPARVLEVNQADASLGTRVATAGDVNGDGYSDVIVAASGYTSGHQSEGAALVWHGGPGGLGVEPDWRVESDQYLGQLNRVATAGDVNGDGYSDVLVGIPFYDDPENNEGVVWLYYGSPFGLQSSSWFGQGDQPGAVFGLAIGTAGDVNGDGFADVIVGAPDYDFASTNEGMVWVFLGNKGDGVDRAPLQIRAGSMTPIDLLGKSDAQTSFRVRGFCRTPAGRGKVRLQIEAKPLGTPFNSTGLVSTAFTITGVPGIDGSMVGLTGTASGLTAGTAYHWRARIATDSPFFPRSPWFWLPGNGATENDIRTGGPPVGVADESPAPPADLVLSAGAPNPFRTETRFQYQVPAAGRVRLGIYDVQGRCVRELADEPQVAGRHAAAWDGKTSAGAELPSGIYFVRLELAGQVTAQKIVLQR